MITRLTAFITTFFRNGWVRAFCCTIWYLAILAALVLLYGQGDFSTPKFIYQGF